MTIEEMWLCKEDQYVSLFWSVFKVKGYGAKRLMKEFHKRIFNLHICCHNLAMLLLFLLDICDFRWYLSWCMCVTSGPNARSPKLRSPKDLSPGVPRRPTAPRVPCASDPAADISRRARTPRSTAEHQLPHGCGGNMVTPQQRQQDASHTSTRNRPRITVNSAHFARSQLQVSSIIHCLQL